MGKPKGEAGKVSKGGLNVKAPKDLKPKFKSKVAAAAADAAGAKKADREKERGAKTEGERADGQGKPSGKNLGKRRRAAAKRQRKREERGLVKAAGGGDGGDDKGKADKPEDKAKKPAKKTKKDKTAADPARAQVESASETPKRGASAALLASSKSIGKTTKGGLLDKLKDRLKGGHFRQLNESLYTTSGDAAFEMFSKAPALFDQYHDGFRHMAAKWPLQPIDVCATWLASKPKTWKVADFGCGDAQLAKTVKQSVTSLDLVAKTPEVIACNIAHTPLDDASMNAVVLCLALMGTDYGAFLREAHRVLAPGGYLWIAEVRSRIEKGEDGENDVTKALLRALKKTGFKCEEHNSSNKMFVVFTLKKMDAKPPPPGIAWPELKPCTYKKR